MRVANARLDFIVDRRVGSVCGYWGSLLKGMAPPERRGLDPGCMKDALPYLWIAEKEEEDRPRFCVRLAGEEVNRLFGKSLRRQFIDRLFPEPVAGEIAAKLRRVIETPALVWILGPFFDAAPEGLAGECAVMPLLVENECRGVLGVTVPNGPMTDPPPRRLYPICQQKEVVTLTELAALA